ncbi:hypothetical protein KUH03_27005 [Sphingobacterium sp. E70]|uniref:hypothetical protein n=1 Tax=Sphingobacterium sp. E70 TaxID=2853439 RepID=UPI00211C7A27|nr:hypothetical protein [Sphingobacterium sp. E70]ULT22909.1 hypothetical protein KUH03_27005 [Sphingobacterium sp. E70]
MGKGNKILFQQTTDKTQHISTKKLAFLIKKTPKKQHFLIIFYVKKLLKKQT